VLFENIHLNAISYREVETFCMNWKKKTSMDPWPFRSAFLFYSSSTSRWSLFVLFKDLFGDKNPVRLCFFDEEMVKMLERCYFVTRKQQDFIWLLLLCDMSGIELILEYFHRSFLQLWSYNMSWSFIKTFIDGTIQIIGSSIGYWGLF